MESVRGISRVARYLVNSPPNLRDARTTVSECFPHFFTHTIKTLIAHEIMRVLKRKP